MSPEAATIASSESLFIIRPSKLTTDNKWLIKQLLMAYFG